MEIVCDMSSNICSKPVDISKYGVIYAGAQKNMGPAGVCIAIVREDLIGKQSPQTPLLCDWKTFAAAPQKLHNTPCCWGIYMAGLNFQYMLSKGGLPYFQELAAKRSGMLLDYIRGSDYY